MLLRPAASFDLAVRLRTEGASLGEVFSFASGLYFRGKIAYARQFAGKNDVVRVITTNRGLVDPDQTIGVEDLKDFARVGIHASEERYVRPLRLHAESLKDFIGSRGKAVLLGSIATGKYRDLLLQILGEQLVFPADFVGRGDMSRGALMLHAAREGLSLSYQMVKGAVLQGRRAGGFRSVQLEQGQPQ
jgi:hypothetical protein